MWSTQHRFRLFFNFLSNRLHRLDKQIQLFLGFALGRLNHQSARHNQRKCGCVWMEPIINQTLRKIHGFHPYTTAFPLIVPGALMIEPTESESKEECDLFIDAMKSIAEEAATTPEIEKPAPHPPRENRLDEAGAAQKPVLRWKP